MSNHTPASSRKTDHKDVTTPTRYFRVTAVADGPESPSRYLIQEESEKEHRLRLAADRRSIRELYDLLMNFSTIEEFSK